ncbi:MAG TPA: hypothetical protein VIH75_00350 [Candidatus Sulfotelmatobacter sp.]
MSRFLLAPQRHHGVDLRGSAAGQYPATAPTARSALEARAKINGSPGVTPKSMCAISRVVAIAQGAPIMSPATLSSNDSRILGADE